MNFLAWIILGGLAGWIGSIIMKTNASMGLLANIIVGIIGAFIGGGLFTMLGGQGVENFSVYSLFVAVVGSVILLGLIRLFTGSKASK